MTEPYEIDNLIIEITRRCNMHCAHCLRGDIPNDGPFDMPEATIDNILRKIRRISHITFSGGEPSLNIKGIWYTLQKLKEYEIGINDFYIVTNGKENVKELLDVSDSLYLYGISSFVDILGTEDALEAGKIMKMVNDEFYGGVALSQDVYHEEIKKENIAILQSRSYYCPNEKRMEEPDCEYLMKRGRSEENGMGTERPVSGFYHDRESHFIEELYVNVKGDCFADCNLSYLDQDELSAGNVNEIADFTELKDIPENN